MIICIMRHGVAEERQLDRPDDERALTKQGAEKMRAAAKGMKRLGLKFDRIWTSPLVRAVQTARIAAEGMGQGELVEETGVLGHEFTCEAVRALLSVARIDDTVLLVGHQPDLGELAGNLLAGPGHDFLPLKKGSLCAIECVDRPAPDSGQLLYYLQSKHLRAIGKERKGEI